jgi:SAM-dependent methyltransferase
VISIDEIVMLQESDYEWLASEQAIHIWERLHSTGDGLEALASEPVIELASPVDRKRLASLLKEQWELSHVAKTKFPNHESWFWTRTLLEQSSDAWCAAETAQDFPTNTSIVDVCCGAGADTLALAACGNAVLAIDQSPISVSLLKANAKLQGQRVEVRCESAEELQLQSLEYLHIDPDRRTTGKRITAIEGLRPSWAVVRSLIASSTGASIKVAPATDWNELDDAPDVVRFLSRERSVRQQRWLWRLDRWPKGSIVVSVHTRGAWVHEVFDQGDQNSPLEAQSNAKDPGIYVADYDPAIRAARVSHVFASRIGCKMLDSAGGYFTADECVPHGIVRWFRVLDVLSMDSKKLRAYARSASVGAWELKSRGVTVDLDKVRKELPTAPDSSKSCTLLFSKISGRPRVIATEPIGGWGIPLSN